MEHETFALRDGSGEVVRWICGVDTGIAGGVFTGCGLTEDAAMIDAFAKAAEENDEARMELGILLGVRGNGMGGRPNGS